MHLNCERLYSEFCKKREEDFYANDVMKFVRGEASGIKPGTLGEVSAKIAKDLIANPPLARAYGDNQQKCHMRHTPPSKHPCMRGEIHE